MRIILCIAVLVLSACGGGGGGVIDMVPPQALELRDNFYGLDIGDVNGDGLNDIVVGSHLTEDRSVVESRIAVYLQDAVAPGTFLEPRHYPYGSGNRVPREVVVLDLDRDGLADIVAAGWDEGGFRVLLNDRSSPGSFGDAIHFGPAREADSLGPIPRVADIDLDGLVDVLLVSDDDLAYFPQDGGDPGAFRSAVSIGSGREDLAVADINDDGTNDIVTIDTSSETPRQVLVYSNNPNSPGTFATVRRFDVDLNVDAVHLGDFDGTGLIDIAILGSDVASDYEQFGAYRLIRQTAPGNFRLTTERRSGGYGAFHSFGIGDLNADGAADLAIRTNNRDWPEPKLRIVRFTSQGDIGSSQDLGVPESNAQFQSDGSPAVVIGDLDNDTLADIAVLSRNVYVFFQLPGQPGRFGTARRITET